MLMGSEVTAYEETTSSRLLDYQAQPMSLEYLYAYVKFEQLLIDLSDVLTYFFCDNLSTVP
jgi:hypothetical protein